MSPETIQKIRRALGEDATTFGRRFGRSGRTVEAWEQGRRRPDVLVLQSLARIVKSRRIRVDSA
jgi:putative transcriptional regulator